MSKPVQTTTIFALAVIFSSAISYVIGAWCGLLRSPVERFTVGSGNEQASVGGSSLTFCGADWTAVGERMGVKMQTTATASASPAELEYTEFATESAKVRIIGTSMYDLNEHNVAAARPVLVPVSRTWQDTSAWSWPERKRLLSEYPLALAQKVFPSAGNSAKVLVRARDGLRQLSGHRPEELQTIQKASYQIEYVSDWDEGRILRNVSSLMASITDHRYGHGPKAAALQRLMARATLESPLIILVLPVSPIYQERTMKPAEIAAFQDFWKTLQPGKAVGIIRLDENPDLHDNRKFGDLVHMNHDGQKLGTEAVMAEIRRLLTP